MERKQRRGGSTVSVKITMGAPLRELKDQVRSWRKSICVLAKSQRQLDGMLSSSSLAPFSFFPYLEPLFSRIINYLGQEI